MRNDDIGPFASRHGRYITAAFAGERVRAFMPSPLPPDPPVDLRAFSALHEEASQALGRLDGVASILPDAPLFLYMYVRKEALLSSQIEGTQSSLSDLLLFELDEIPGVPITDVREVSHYVAAMNYGLGRLRTGFPLSTRLIREIHAQLLEGGRGADKTPGTFRRTQNWIGGTRPGNATFVPPPAHEVDQCMSDLERFLHAERPDMPTLIRAGLAHVQFETIRPFLDGNGRVGRLLITLLLCEKGVMRQPLLYLSLFLKANRRTYYDLLQGVRDRGDWEGWLEFFLRGVRDTSNQAAETARKILTLFEADRRRIAAIGRAAAVTLRLHQHLQRKPMVSIRSTAEELAISKPSAAHALHRLQALGIVAETSGRRRGRLFAYAGYLALLNEGTEPIPA